MWTYNAPLTAGADWQNYWQWIYIGSTSTLKVGDGFTMKGTGGAAPVTATQNYVFIGKPNSGTILLNLGLGKTYLAGNPYPSALDADEFIKDNLKDCIGCRATENKFSGVLSFWDHFNLSNNHLLAEYKGGYAMYTLAGGVVGINNSPLTANDNATGTKIPERFIPVSQGFFISAPNIIYPTTQIVGGNIVFNNSQRAFKREAKTGNNAGSIFMRTTKTKSSLVENNTTIDLRSKIRLSFYSPGGIHRKLLVTADLNTTNHFDIGYDAPMMDNSKEDMYWYFDNNKFIIQGVNNFNLEQVLPIGIRINTNGLSTIRIDAIENWKDGTEIYIKDNLDGETYNIKDQHFEINLAAGEYKDRFALVFQSRLKTIAEISLEDGLLTYMNNDNSEIQVNKIVDTNITGIVLYNYLGQKIKTWDTRINERYNSLPVNVATGVYIVQVKTSNGTVNKKIFIE